LSNELNTLVQKFSEHYHDAWSQARIEAGWTYSPDGKDEENKKHARLKPYPMLSEFEKETYREPVRHALKALLALTWQVEYGESAGAFAGLGSHGQQQHHSQQHDSNPYNYNPTPADMSNLTLSKEMMNLAEVLSEDAHDIQALSRQMAQQAAGTTQIDLMLVPYDLLTDKEKRKNRERCQELLKYIQYQGYKLFKEDQGKTTGKKNPENKFANNLLEKLIMYADSSTPNMKLLKPSSSFSRRNSFTKTDRMVKFFFKVVLPLVEKYFSHHRVYFNSVASSPAASAAGVASIREKESVANLFCKLANLLRMRQLAFGSDDRVAVKCLQVLVKAVDARSLAKMRPEFVRTSMLLFFNNCADDLEKTISNLHEVLDFKHVLIISLCLI